MFPFIFTNFSSVLVIDVLTTVIASKLGLFLSLLIFILRANTLIILPKRLGIIPLFRSFFKTQRKKREFLIWFKKRFYKINRKLNNNKIIKKLFWICHKITKRYFLQKHLWLFTCITYLSGIGVGLFFWLRIMIVLGYFLPGQTMFLCFFALNSLFRIIISLGLILRVGNGGAGEQFWRRLTEEANKNKGSMGGHFTPNNHQHKHTHYHFNSEPQRDRYWAKAGTIAAVVSAGGTVIALAVRGGDVSGELRETKTKLNVYEDKVKQRDMLINLSDSIIDTLQKQRESLTEQNESLTEQLKQMKNQLKSKEIADNAKERENLEKTRNDRYLPHIKN